MSSKPSRGDYDRLDQGLISRPDDEEDGNTAQTTVAQPMIEVTAPATLPEGYKLDVQLGTGRTYTVVIPMGGVQGGQRFQVPLPGRSGGSALASDGEVEELTTAIARVSVPVGQWRDGICCCFSQGIIHPVLCNAIFCHAVAIAQVMVRLRLNLMGNPITVRHGAKELAKQTFWIILAAMLGELLLYHLIVPSVMIFSSDPDTADTAVIVAYFFRFALIVACIFWSTRTRLYIRQKYAIPPVYLGGAPLETMGSSDTQSCHIEDCLCATFCYCCSVSQMARHTMEFDTYPATCCTPTGVREHAPDLVV